MVRMADRDKEKKTHHLLIQKPYSGYRSAKDSIDDMRDTSENYHIDILFVFLQDTQCVSNEKNKNDLK